MKTLSASEQITVKNGSPNVLIFASTQCFRNTEPALKSTNLLPDCLKQQLFLSFYTSHPAIPGPVTPPLVPSVVQQSQCAKED